MNYNSKEINCLTNYESRSVQSSIIPKLKYRRNITYFCHVIFMIILVVAFPDFE